LVDLDAEVWTIPGDRMKAGREHRVPLAPAALNLLKRMREAYPKSTWVSPGSGKSETLSAMALLMTLRRMKRTNITAHGFRSTFRDWAAEQTAFAREIAERHWPIPSGTKQKRRTARRRVGEAAQVDGRLGPLLRCAEQQSECGSDPEGERLVSRASRTFARSSQRARNRRNRTFLFRLRQ